jgi:YVTN family beta-propeller protein
VIEKSYALLYARKLNPVQSFQYNDYSPAATRYISNKVSDEPIHLITIWRDAIMKNLSFLFAFILVVTLSSCNSNDKDDIVIDDPRTCELEKVYVANYESDSVSVIELCNHTVANTITVGDQPTIWGYSDTKHRVFVVNDVVGGNGTVSVINTDTETVVATLVVGTGPADSGLDDVRGILYVTNTADDTVSVFNTTDYTTFTPDANSPLTVGAGPRRVAINTTNGKTYVAMTNRDVYIFDGTNLSVTPEMVDVTGGAGNPVLRRMIYNEINNKVYVSRSHSGTTTDDRVAIIDTANSIETSVVVGEGAARFGIDNAGNVYVAADESNLVSRISVNDNSVTDFTTATGGPNGITVSGDGTRMYVSNPADDSVSLIETATPPGTRNDINVGDFPLNLALSEAQNKLYVSNRGETEAGTTVSVIDLTNNQVIATVIVGTNPRSMRVVTVPNP